MYFPLLAALSLSTNRRETLRPFCWACASFCVNDCLTPSHAAIGKIMPEIYQLRCRECGKLWGNSPKSFCEDCFSPLEVSFDYDALKALARREKLGRNAISICGAIRNFFRCRKVLRLPTAVGGTPLVSSQKSRQSNGG